MQVLNQDRTVPEYFKYLLEHPQSINHAVVLQYTVNGGVSSQNREILLYWTIDLSNKLSISIPTTLLACNYIDHFLSRKLLTNTNALQVVGIIAVSLASKFRDGITITPSQIKAIIDEEISEDVIVTTEKYFLSVINWELFLVNSGDFIQSICELTIGEGSGKVASMAYTYAVFGYCDKEFACRGSFNTAIASIILSINKLGYSQMKNLWIEVVRDRFQVDLESVNESIQVLESKVKKLG